MLIGKVKRWGDRREGMIIEKVSEGTYNTKIMEEGIGMNICTMYDTGSWKDIEGIFENLKKGMRRRIKCSRDFNIRVGEQGDGVFKMKKSKDKVIGNGGTFI